MYVQFLTEPLSASLYCYPCSYSVLPRDSTESHDQADNICILSPAMLHTTCESSGWSCNSPTLHRVAAASDVNLMKASNIGVCFGPTLMRPERESVATIVDIKYQNIIVEVMVDNVEEVSRNCSVSCGAGQSLHHHMFYTMYVAMMVFHVIGALHHCVYGSDIQFLTEPLLVN